MALVLITGGAGFIGSHTADKLIEEGFDVRIIDNLQKPVHKYGKPEYLNKKAEFILGDVRKKEDMEKAMKDVDYIYHFAAYQDYLPDLSNFILTNAYSTALIYEVIIEKKLKIKKVIVASSQFVQGEGMYKDQEGNIYKPKMRLEEDMKKGLWDFCTEKNEKLKWQWTDETFSNPPNAYALSKHSLEEQAIVFGTRYEIPSVALRYSIVQGARQSVYNLYSGACRIFSLNYYLGQSPIIFEDGNQRRDFINISDVVNANILVLKDDKANFEVFNIGSGKDYTLLEFDRAVAKIYGKESYEPLIPGEYRFGDTRNACSNTEKIKALGWKAEKNILDSLAEYKEYLLCQKDLNDILAKAKYDMKNHNVIRSINK